MLLTHASRYENLYEYTVDVNLTNKSLLFQKTVVGKIRFSYFVSLVPFCTSRKYQKRFSFLMISGSTERDQWHKIG